MQETRDRYRYDAELISYINTVFGANPDDKVFENYLVSLKTAGNISPRTETLYIKDLFGTYDPPKNFIRSAEFTFLNFLSLKNVRSPADITREMLREYVVWLVENGIAKTSVNRRLSSIRSFYKFLLDEGKVKVSPIPVRTHQRHSPRSSLSMKLDQKIPHFLTQPDMEKLLNSPDITRPEGRRDRAILELLYASGLRVSELWQLELDSLNLETREIRVIGKGSKERVVLMGLPAVAAVKDYLLKARPELVGKNTDKALFLNYQGRRLSMRSIQILLRRYAKSVELEKEVHPHVIRHTFATHMLDGGADLRVVQELLGHADLSTTQIYTHVTKQQARKVYLKTHPMAQEEDKSNGNQGTADQTPPETG